MSDYDRILVFEEGTLLLRVGAILYAKDPPEKGILQVITQTCSIDVTGGADQGLVRRAMNLANFTHLGEHWVNAKAIDSVEVGSTPATTAVERVTELLFNFPGDIELVVKGPEADLFLKIQSEMP